MTRNPLSRGETKRELMSILNIRHGLPNRNEMAGKKVILEIKKLELEIRKLELEIVYIDTKTRNLDKKATTIRTNK